jgi:hypothetical protein
VLYFSFVETAVISMINSIVPNYMQQALASKNPAGGVAKDFQKYIGKLPEGDGRSELEKLAARFVTAVERRNDLLHAMPASLGEYTHLVRLTQDRFVAWSTAALMQLATEFENLADDLYVAHHDLLQRLK